MDVLEKQSDVFTLSSGAGLGVRHGAVVVIPARSCNLEYGGTRGGSLS